MRYVHGILTFNGELSAEHFEYGEWKAGGGLGGVERRNVHAATLVTTFDETRLSVVADADGWRTENGEPIASFRTFFLDRAATQGWEVLAVSVQDDTWQCLLRRAEDNSARDAQEQAGN